MANALCVAYLLLFLSSGLVYAAFLPVKLAFLPRALLGLCFGLFLLIWLPALYAFLLGFALAAQLLALATAVLPAALLCLWKRAPLQRLRPADLPELKRLLFLTLPTLALCACLLYTHVLRPQDGSLHTGQSCYGDMAMHLAFITSISRNACFPPQYSIQVGTQMGYPFLCDSVSSTFLTLGGSLRFAYVLPMLPALFLVFAWFYLLMREMLSSPRSATLAFVLFFVGGGFGFVYFLDGAAADTSLFTRLFTSFYETPTNLVSENVYWVNPICDMLIPQRATLFGWAVLLPCLYLLLRAGIQGQAELFWPLAILAGGLPLLHSHSFMALGVISASVFAWQLIRRPSCWKGFVLYAGLAAALALPQLLCFTFRQAAGEGFIRLTWNWINEQDPYLWFYIKNWGLVFLLLPFALLNARGKRGLFLCSLPLWVLVECLVFQPNAYDNNKLLFVCYMLACGLVADFLLFLYDRLDFLRGRRLAAALTLATMTVSGWLTIGREIVSDYELFSSQQVEAAAFAATLPTDAVLLTADEHNNAFASLSGLTIVQGSPSYLYFHGVYDEERAQDVLRMYTEPGALAQLGPKYGVTHVVLSNHELAMGADERLFADLPLLYDSGGIRIYSVS